MTSSREYQLIPLHGRMNELNGLRKKNINPSLLSSSMSLNLSTISNVQFLILKSKWNELKIRERMERAGKKVNLLENWEESNANWSIVKLTSWHEYDRGASKLASMMWSEKNQTKSILIVKWNEEDKILMLYLFFSTFRWLFSCYRQLRWKWTWNWH